MIELRSLPLRGGVTRFALGRKVSLPVVGVRGLVEIGLMATTALLRGSSEAAIDVAARALCIRVRAGQRESCKRAVIEPRTRPTGVGMTVLTVLREACRNMVWILRLGELLGVAGEAVRRNALKLAANVAGLAGHAKVGAGQCESGESRMVEPATSPVVHGVARFTSQRQVRGLVVQRGGTSVIRKVA